MLMCEQRCQKYYNESGLPVNRFPGKLRQRQDILQRVRGFKKAACITELARIIQNQLAHFVKRQPLDRYLLTGVEVGFDYPLSVPRYKKRMKPFKLAEWLCNTYQAPVLKRKAGLFTHFPLGSVQSSLRKAVLPPARRLRGAIRHQNRDAVLRWSGEIHQQRSGPCQTSAFRSS